ncbi:restriction endonuclease [Candidatus Pacearchaeota archaeon]|nr:restriction endonuclease [Candidatus Pacearchaeota archaeon]
MELQLYNQGVFDKYKSNTQRIRVLSEDWAEKNLFCVSCLSEHILKLKAGTPVADFICEICQETFQLKSQNNTLAKKIVDGAFSTMIQSIKEGTRPNFLFLQYTKDYCVKNLLIVPSFFFVEEIIEKRRPLSENARRRGWVGCNLLMEKIPKEGRISIIKDGAILEKKEVNEKWRKVDFMKKTPLSERGWTIDILNVIHSLSKKTFQLDEIYRFEGELARIHPNNLHIKDKIRQQLQILRDKGFLRFKGNGAYELD